MKTGLGITHVERSYRIMNRLRGKLVQLKLIIPIPVRGVGRRGAIHMIPVRRVGNYGIKTNVPILSLKIQRVVTLQLDGIISHRIAQIRFYGVG